MATPSCPLAMDVQDPIQDTAITGNEKGTGEDPQASVDVGFHLPNFPLWTRWALVSILSYAIPLYKNVRRIEGKVEEAATTLVEDVERVSTLVQKVSADIADVLPEDSVVEYDFVMVERIAEEVNEEAKKAEAFIKKVDEVKEQVEEKLEPYVRKGEGMVGQGTAA